MAKQLEIYKCDICGNIVEVLHGGPGQLVCCGKPMRLFEEKATEEGNEKHLPVIEDTPKGIKVKVGSIPHPMEEKHYIEWIRVVSPEGVMRKFLAPGEKPEAEFPVPNKDVKATEFCNVHGLWTKE
jgi:superoxide reductase